MEKSLRHILPAWLGCISLPLPAILLWRSNYGRTIALCLFFIGCANLVSSVFRKESRREIAGGVEYPKMVWRSRMLTLSMALFTAFGIFSLLLLVLSDTRDFVAVALAFLIL